MSPQRVRMAVAGGTAALAIGFAVLLTHAELHDGWSPAPSASVSPPAPATTGFVLEQQSIVDRSAGFTLDVPDPWTKWDPPYDGGSLEDLGVFLRHPQGVYLNANVGLRTPGAGVEPTLQGILEDKLGQYGEAIDDIEWGRDLLANQFNARTVAFTIHRQEVGVRCRIWGFATGSYWLSLSCGAPAPAFPAAEALCRKVFDTFRVQPMSR